ncbi:hypothetical protein MSG28_007789 [Choristoneura fumiferana]|uniref:Uncharacterized protein n=1 Tax=Choristoneura fumiferana TaxID=7141 RepID=A0ACC0JYU3_CHOFU|nr:hypothetical protein MSG28_007789 [Choristoneura fumiferana]
MEYISQTEADVDCHRWKKIPDYSIQHHDGSHHARPDQPTAPKIENLGSRNPEETDYGLTD